MSGELEQVEVCKTYAEAAIAARRLASLIGELTFVRRSGEAWLVLAHPDHLPSVGWLEQDDSCEMSDDEYAEYDLERYLEHEVFGPLREEVSDYEDGYARSSEDGWYYED